MNDTCIECGAKTDPHLKGLEPLCDRCVTELDKFYDAMAELEEVK